MRPPNYAKRRTAAAIAVVVIAVVVWLVAIRPDDDDEGRAGTTPTAKGGSQRIGDLLGDLSEEEKVDQLVLAGFEGRGEDAEIGATLRDDPLGGVLIGPENWPGAADGKKMIEELLDDAKESGDIPPLVAAAQEGGPYRALEDLPPDERAIEIGDFAEEDRAEEWAEDAGKALDDVGVDLDLAPLADVATLDSPIADRSFSDDSAVAASMTAAALRGCRKAEIACAVGHFPGLGAASQDPATGPATVGLDRATLSSRDLAPFEAAIGAKVPAVVLSLAFYSAYDPVTPAALDPEIVTGLLREELGFEGVAITDDLESGAIRAGSKAPDAAVAAVVAGADMVQVSSTRDALSARDALVKAVQSGEISSDRLDEAVGRVLKLKASLGTL
jgi:beta-N-acetylhexosaminidase